MSLPVLRRALTPLTTLLAVLVLTLGALAVVESAAPDADAKPPKRADLWWGATGDVASLQRATGQRYAVHHYSYFESQVPEGRMFTVNFRQNLRWRQVANLSTGSAAYKRVVAWANVLKRRDAPVFLAYQHEPEFRGNSYKGSAADFKAAFRRIVTIFRSHGASKVVFVWQMTSYAFVVGPSAYNYGPRWYPGNSYVDVVGLDPYNFYRCGEGVGRWKPFSELVPQGVAFARNHGKQVAFPEYASVPDPRRPAWIRGAGAYMANHDDIVALASYYNHPPDNNENADCTWKLNDRASQRAFAEQARRQKFRP